MRILKIILAVIITIIITSCQTNKTCAVNATLKFDGFSNCEFLIIQDDNGTVYQANNLTTFNIAPFDGKHIIIDFQVLSDPPTCPANSVINLLCVSE